MPVSSSRTSAATCAARVSAVSPNGSGPASLATIRAAVIAALKDACTASEPSCSPTEADTVLIAPLRRSSRRNGAATSSGTAPVLPRMPGVTYRRTSYSSAARVRAPGQGRRFEPVRPNGAEPDLPDEAALWQTDDSRQSRLVASGRQHPRRRRRASMPVRHEDPPGWTHLRKARYPQPSLAARISRVCKEPFHPNPNRAAVQLAGSAGNLPRSVVTERTPVARVLWYAAALDYWLGNLTVAGPLIWLGWLCCAVARRLPQP